MKTALITGATSGIGEATAQLLAAHHYRLLLCGRRLDRLQALQTTLSAKTEVHVFTLDVRDREAVDQSIQSLPEDWKNIDVLVNNAGLAAGIGPVHKGDPDDWDRMIDTNVKGVLYMLRAVLPGMIERNSGHVMQISSIASKDVYENGNVYCASKTALDAITKSIRLELLPYEIKVTSIHPGMAETEFSLVRFKNDAEKAAKVYARMEPLTGKDIAESILYCLQVPTHVNIQELIITPAAQAGVGKVRLS